MASRTSASRTGPRHTRLPELNNFDVHGPRQLAEYRGVAQYYMCATRRPGVSDTRWVTPLPDAARRCSVPTAWQAIRIRPSTCELLQSEGYVHLDIASGRGYPAAALSNFAPHRFVFDGVECQSMEGLLQAFKFKEPSIQREVCRLVGAAAKRRGSQRNWQRKQALYWGGLEYKRSSSDYQRLLDRAFSALATNQDFRRALYATEDAVLTHSIGKHNPAETVLTRREFCAQLTRLRAEMRTKTV